MSDAFTSVMHHKPHAPEHAVRIYDTSQVFVVCRDCGMHDWGEADREWTVDDFKTRYGDRVLEVVGMDPVVMYECEQHPDHIYPEEALIASGGHWTGPDYDDDPNIRTCSGPMKEVKGGKSRGEARTDADLHGVGDPVRRFIGYRPLVPGGYIKGGYGNAPNEPQYEGVVFSDGTTVLRWLTKYRSTSVWPSFEEMEKVHGHPD